MYSVEAPHESVETRPLEPVFVDARERKRIQLMRDCESFALRRKQPRFLMVHVDKRGQIRWTTVSFDRLIASLVSPESFSSK